MKYLVPVQPDNPHHRPHSVCMIYDQHFTTGEPNTSIAKLHRVSRMENMNEINKTETAAGHQHDQPHKSTTSRLPRRFNPPRVDRSHRSRDEERISKPGAVSTPVKSSDDGILSQASDQASSRDEKLLPPLPGTPPLPPHQPSATGIRSATLFLLCVFLHSGHSHGQVPVCVGPHASPTESD